MGQSNHAARNAFLDSCVHYLENQGIDAWSINWGAWSDIGYAARAGADKTAQALGLSPIKPQEGLNIIEEVLQLKEGGHIATGIDAKEFSLNILSHSGYGFHLKIKEE